MTTALSPIRRIISARMTESKRAIPRLRMSADIEVDSLLNLPQELPGNDSTIRLSVNDLLIKACTTALMNVPAVNIHWVEGENDQYRRADNSIVTAAECGLPAPIVRGADSKTGWDITREVRNPTSRAAKGTLNVGGSSGALCQHLQYRHVQRGSVRLHHQCATMRVTPSIGHRALDGTVAAAFLSALRHRLERLDYLGLTLSG